MMMQSMCKKIVCFDLDDTLYKEIDYVKSAFRFISHRLNGATRNVFRDDVYDTLWSTFLQKGDAFDEVIRRYGLQIYTKDDLLEWYRYHSPSVSLDDNVRDTLNDLQKHGVVLGIISDGRVLTQMNKIKALGLLDYIKKEDVVINDIPERHKPDLESFRQFMTKYGPNNAFVYVGDNTKKDFRAPNHLGWTTVCLLDDGRNIHKQVFASSPEDFPQYRVSTFPEIEKYCI